MDIVLAFCYNEILGIEANHHEAGVTINKISSSLSCLAESDNICSVLKSFVRRVLVYGLYRNMEIAHKAIKDTKDLFEKLTVVKILI